MEETVNPTTLNTNEVNVVVQQLADRLRRCDSTLSSTVSLRRLPVADVSPAEVLHILEALQDASTTMCTTTSPQHQKRISTASTITAYTECSEDYHRHERSSADDADDIHENDDNDEEDLYDYDDDVSLSCPVTALHMWLPDHASNNNRSSTTMMESLEGSISYGGSDSNDGDLFFDASLNSSSSSLLNQERYHDSLESMDWERGNASGNTVVMHDDPQAAAVVVEDDDTDANDDVQQLQQQNDSIEQQGLEAPQESQPQPQEQQEEDRQDDQNVRLPPPDYSILTSLLAKNTSIVELACSSAANSAAWKNLFRGVGQNRGSIQTLELGDACLIADATTLETDACRTLSEQVLTKSSSKDSKSSAAGLKHLVLRGFSLPLQGVEYLARGFEKNETMLQSIEVQQIETDPGSFGRLLESFASCRSLKRIVLSDCDLGIDMLLDDHPLTLLLSNSRSLEVLRMTECQVTAVELQAMATATTPGTPTLKVLDLRGNELGLEAAPALAQLVSKQTSLEKLILEDNQLDDAALKILRTSLSRHPSLCKINLRGNSLSSKSIDRSLVLPATLKVFDLSENDLGTSTTRGSSHGGDSNGSNGTTGPMGDWTGFFQCNALRKKKNWSLVLEATSLTDADLVSLCQGLEQSPSCFLQSLNVGQNGFFGSMGMQSIARVLSSTSKKKIAIQSLSLASCQLSDKDVAILVPGLTQCPSLCRLYLGFNQIGDAGCRSLGMALAEKACHVQELQLQFNPFGATGLGYLVEGLKHNVHIQQIGIMNASAQCNQTQQLIQEMRHWLSLNRAGRQALCSSFPAAIWPTILARAGMVSGPTALYYLLQEQSSRVA